MKICTHDALGTRSIHSIGRCRGAAPNRNAYRALSLPAAARTPSPHPRCWRALLEIAFKRASAERASCAGRVAQSTCCLPRSGARGRHPRPLRPSRCSLSSQAPLRRRGRAPQWHLAASASPKSLLWGDQFLNLGEVFYTPQGFSPFTRVGYRYHHSLQGRPAWLARKPMWESHLCRPTAAPRRSRPASPPLHRCSQTNTFERLRLVA